MLDNARLFCRVGFSADCVARDTRKVRRVSNAHLKYRTGAKKTNVC